MIDCKLMKIYKLSDKEFRIILKEFQGSIRKHRRLHEIRKKNGRTKLKFNEELETIKKRSRNTRVEEYIDCTEEVNREHQQQTQPSRRMN